MDQGVYPFVSENCILILADKELAVNYITLKYFPLEKD